MRIGITTNTADLIGRWRARGAAIDREQRRITPEIALVLKRESQRVLRVKIYAVPIPQTRGGKPAWRRTGDLIGREDAKADGVDVVMTNDSAHAEARLLLGTPYGRPIRSPGVQQVDWQAEAIKNRRAWILKVRRDAQVRALRR
jgi:hypothetical protein